MTTIPPPNTLPDDPDAIAPDGSETRLLQTADAASVVHCTLPPGAVSLAVRHRTVTEMWVCIGGRGDVWRGFGDEDGAVPFTPGVSLIIPVGTYFQFRNTGDAPLTFIITTTPPWPGPDEAVRVDDHWPTT